MGYKAQWQYCWSTYWKTWRDMDDEPMAVLEAAVKGKRSRCQLGNPIHIIVFIILFRSRLIWFKASVHPSHPQLEGGLQPGKAGRRKRYAGTRRVGEEYGRRSSTFEKTKRS